ncbi:unnamed protein product [Cercospora beticola]|nr:unnamed protein product [Cercospora beticola]
MTVYSAYGLDSGNSSSLLCYHPSPVKQYTVRDIPSSSPYSSRQILSAATTSGLVRYFSGHELRHALQVVDDLVQKCTTFYAWRIPSTRKSFCHFLTRQAA